MIEIGFSSSFNRAYKKIIKFSPEVESKFWEKIDLFYENPFNNSLKTHKLVGKLNHLWSFSIDYSLRVIFYFESDTKITLIDIGSHDEVY